MSKVIPPCLLIGMAGMLVISWSNVLNFGAKQDEEYTWYINEAKALEDKEIYIDAVKRYQSAYNLKPDYELSIKIVDLYEKLKQPRNAADALRTAIKTDPTQKDPYIRLMDYYLQGSKYSDAMKLAEEAEDALGIDPDIENRMLEIRSKYSIISLTTKIYKPLHYIDNGSRGQYVDIFKDQLGILDGKHKEVLAAGEYEDLGLLHEDLAPVKRKGEWYYVDQNSYRKLVPDRPAEYLGIFNSGYAPAKFDGKYGYVDKKLKEYHFEYEFAGCFESDIAPVKKDGKWMVINTSFAPVTEDRFDEILCDGYGFCSTYGVFIAKKDGKYYIYDKQGNVKSEGFEDAKMFASLQPTAMKKDGKWCFVSTEGEIILTTDYEDANPFSLGYAPVSDGKTWGCIDQRANVLIPLQFDTMEPFTKNGYSVVTKDEVMQYVIVSTYD